MLFQRLFNLQEPYNIMDILRLQTPSQLKPVLQTLTLFLPYFFGCHL